MDAKSILSAIGQNLRLNKEHSLPEKVSHKQMLHGVFEGQGKNRRVYIEGLGLVDNFLASDDLNICVEALLHKRSKNAG